MMNKTICIDIDNTIARYNYVFCKAFKKEFGFPLHVRQLTAHSGLFEDTGLISKKQALSILRGDKINQRLINLPLYKNAKETINKLSKNFQIILITGRNNYSMPQMRTDTKNWAHKNKIIYKKLFFTQHKACTAKRLDASFFIEDNAKTAINISKSDITVLLINRPWNQKMPLNGKSIIRCKGWNDVFAKISGLSSTDDHE